GVPVLSTVEPDRGDGALDDVERRVFLLDSATGVHAASAAADAPQTVRAFSWLCFSRAEVKELRQFIDARRGRGGAFWVLSWERDFDLVADQGANSSTLTVLGRDFSSRVFPTGQGRRHLGIRAPGGSFYYRHVDGAVDNLNGTETLQLDAAVPDALPAAGTFLASLRYSRLDADGRAVGRQGRRRRVARAVSSLPIATAGAQGFGYDVFERSPTSGEPVE